MKTNTDFAKHISIFLSDYLPHHRNVSANTIKAYTATFIQFVFYMRDRSKTPIEKLTLDKFNKENVVFSRDLKDDAHSCSFLKDKPVHPSMEQCELYSLFLSVV